METTINENLRDLVKEIEGDLDHIDPPLVSFYDQKVEEWVDELRRFGLSPEDRAVSAVLLVSARLFITEFDEVALHSHMPDQARAAGLLACADAAVIARALWERGGSPATLSTAPSPPASAQASTRPLGSADRGPAEGGPSASADQTPAGYHPYYPHGVACAHGAHVGHVFLGSAHDSLPDTAQVMAPPTT